MNTPMTAVVPEVAVLKRRQLVTRTTTRDVDTVAADQEVLSAHQSFDLLWREFVRINVRLRLFESIFAGTQAKCGANKLCVAELQNSLGDALLAQVSSLAGSEAGSQSFRNLVKRLKLPFGVERKTFEQQLADLDDACMPIEAHRDRLLLEVDSANSTSSDAARLCADISAALRAMRPLIDALNVVFGTNKNTSVEVGTTLSQQAQKVARQLHTTDPQEPSDRYRKNVFRF